MKRKTLGDILLEMGVIDELQLTAALAHQRQWGVPLGRALVEKRLCGHDHIVHALQRQSGLPLIDLKNQPLSPATGPLLSVKVAQQHKVVPLRLEGRRGETLVVAIAAPASLSSLDAVQQVSGKQRVVAHLATDEDIGLALNVIYGVDNPFAQPAAPRFGAEARVENEHEFDDGSVDVPMELESTDAEAVSVPPRPTVLLYGWPDAAAAALSQLILGAGIDVRTATDELLSAARAVDVVLAPLPAVEAALARGVRSGGKLVVAGRNPEADLPRAQALSACGFVPAPLEPDYVLHVLRRVHKRDELRETAQA